MREIRVHGIPATRLRCDLKDPYSDDLTSLGRLAGYDPQHGKTIDAPSNKMLQAGVSRSA